MGSKGLVIFEIVGKEKKKSFREKLQSDEQ